MHLHSNIPMQSLKLNNEPLQHYTPWSYGSNDPPNTSATPRTGGARTTNYGTDIITGYNTDRTNNAPSDYSNSFGISPKLQGQCTPSGGSYEVPRLDANPNFPPSSDENFIAPSPGNFTGSKTPGRKRLDFSDKSRFPNHYETFGQKQFGYNSADLESSFSSPDKFNISINSERFRLDDLVSQIIDDEQSPLFGSFHGSGNGKNESHSRTSDVFSFDGSPSTWSTEDNSTPCSQTDRYTSYRDGYWDSLNTIDSGIGTPDAKFEHSYESKVKEFLRTSQLSTGRSASDSDFISYGHQTQPSKSTSRQHSAPVIDTGFRTSDNLSHQTHFLDGASHQTHYMGQTVQSQQQHYTGHMGKARHTGYNTANSSDAGHNNRNLGTSQWPSGSSSAWPTDDTSRQSQFIQTQDNQTTAVQQSLPQQALRSNQTSHRIQNENTFRPITSKIDTSGVPRSHEMNMHLADGSTCSITHPLHVVTGQVMSSNIGHHQGSPRQHWVDSANRRSWTDLGVPIPGLGSPNARMQGIPASGLPGKMQTHKLSPQHGSHSSTSSPIPFSYGNHGNRTYIDRQGVPYNVTPKHDVLMHSSPEQGNTPVRGGMQRIREDGMPAMIPHQQMLSKFPNAFIPPPVPGSHGFITPEGYEFIPFDPYMQGRLPYHFYDPNLMFGGMPPAALYGFFPGFKHRRPGPSNELHLRLEDCYDQFKCLERERKSSENYLNRGYPGKKISSNNNIVIPRLPSNPSRVDRLVVDSLREHSKVITLISKMEKLCPNGVHANIQSAMEKWMEGIRKVQARRREEVVNATNRQRNGGPRHQEDKDVIALATSIAELTVLTRHSRTAFWCCVQMATKHIPLVDMNDDLYGDDLENFAQQIARVTAQDSTKDRRQDDGDTNNNKKSVK